MIIKINAVNKVTKQSKTGKRYQAIEVNYESDGRTTNYTLFSNDPLAQRILGADTSRLWDVRVVKDGDYFKWADLTEAGEVTTKAPPVSVGATGSGVAGNVKGVSSSTYSTKEEREDTQRKIVRQFAINAAINFLKTEKKSPIEDEVFETAEKFVAFVYSTPQPSKEVLTKKTNFDDLEGDLPF